MFCQKLIPEDVKVNIHYVFQPKYIYIFQSISRQREWEPVMDPFISFGFPHQILTWCDYLSLVMTTCICEVSPNRAPQTEWCRQQNFIVS